MRFLKVGQIHRVVCVVVDVKVVEVRRECADEHELRCGRAQNDGITPLPYPESAFLISFG